MEVGPHVATMYAEILTNEVRNARIADVVAQWEKRNGTGRRLAEDHL